MPLKSWSGFFNICFCKKNDEGSPGRRKTIRSRGRVIAEVKCDSSFLKTAVRRNISVSLSLPSALNDVQMWELVLTICAPHCNCVQCNINTFTFIRRFYPKWLTVRLRYTFFLLQYVCFLGFEPTTFALLTQCSTNEPQEHNI